MERQIIESMVASLPISEIGKIPEDHEIWEEMDGRACLTVTRHILTSTIDGSEHEIISLQVSGEPEERIRVIGQFIEVFGAHPRTDLGQEGTGEPDTLIWVVNN